MSRTSIQQFRATLADTANQSGPVRAYRALTRRPAVDARIAGDWAVWPPVAATSGWIPWANEAVARA